MTPRAQVAFAIDGSFIGGGHRHVLMLAQKVQRYGFFPLVITSAPGPFSVELTRLGLNWIVLPMGKKPTPSRYFQWKKILTDRQIDILHLHGGVAGMWGRWAAPADRKFKIVLTLHGIHYLHHPNPIVSAVSKIVDQVLRNKGDLIICVSKADVRLAEETGVVDPSKTVVIYNGIEVSRYQTSEPRVQQNISQMETVQVGVVGRLTKMKGQRYALEALSLLKDKFPGLRLVFFGIGEDEADLKFFSSSFGVADRVRFAGFQDDMPHAYQQLFINMLPSLWEGQPLTLMESLASGVPTIASGLDCVREIVTDGRECLLVPPRDAASLAKALERLLLDESLRANLVLNGREAAKRFDVDRMVEETVQQYQALLGPGK